MSNSVPSRVSRRNGPAVSAGGVHSAGHLLLLLGMSVCLSAAQAAVTVPAFTAYLVPNAGETRVGADGITGWRDPSVKVKWYGQINTPGKLHCSVRLSLPAAAESKLRLVAGKESSEATATGVGSDSTTVDFGSLRVEQPGYLCIELQMLNQAGTPAGDIHELILDGAAATDAHFNLTRRRNAASVHLAYPVASDTPVAEFYCEVIAVEDPVATFYMACGWHRGYFGMQVNSPTERRIIFSVWDSGSEPVDRNNVDVENRVTLVAKGEGVEARDFGNEGTGGHSHLKYLWKTRQTQRFVVTANPVSATETVFSGFYFHPVKREWMLISSWKAPKDGGWLRGLYSFSENFAGFNGHLQRKALFGNQWIRVDGIGWKELTTATFSLDATGRRDRLDRFMGVEEGRFFLSNGGFIPGFTEFGQAFERPATGRLPTDMILPALPLDQPDQ